MQVRFNREISSFIDLVGVRPQGTVISNEIEDFVSEEDIACLSGLLTEYNQLIMSLFSCVSSSKIWKITDKVRKNSQLGQNRSGQVRTGRERLGQVGTGWDGSGQNGTGQDSLGQDRSGQVWRGLDRTGQEI